MKKIRIGIVGSGFGQQVLIPAFRTHPNCEIAAVCCTRIEKAREIAARLKIPAAFDDWRELLNSNIDALAIATPPETQFQIAKLALKRRIPVFCEKPLTRTVAQSRELAQLARTSNAANMVDFEFMEIPAFHAAQTAIRSGEIGAIRHAAIVWQVETYANKMGLSSWKTDSLNGGGTLNSFVSHSFYYAEQLFGTLTKISAKLHHAPTDSRPGDTTVHLSMLTAAGSLISACVSGHSFLGSGHRLEIYGDQGTLILENSSADYARGFRLLKATRETGRLAEMPLTDPDDVPANDGRIAPVSRLAGQFLNWIEKGTEARPNFEDGLRVQYLIEATRQSDASGAWVDVAEETRIG